MTKENEDAKWLEMANEARAEGFASQESVDQLLSDFQEPKLIDMRAEFENWYSDNSQFPKAVERSGDGYKLMQAQQSWMAWQAAWKRIFTTNNPKALDLKELEQALLILKPEPDNLGLKLKIWQKALRRVRAAM